MDMYLPAEDMPAQTIHVVRHSITLGSNTYLSGSDIQPAALYDMLTNGAGFPTTSQPSVGDYVALFRKLAASDRDILCVGMSSGLSGTVNSAKAAAALVPEANVTVVDSKTLSGVMGWQVAAAAKAAAAGWTTERIVGLIEKIVAVSDSIYTLDDLKYLIHGGRISHMKGLIASVLHIKPIIGVAKGTGAYEQLAQERTFERAIKGLANVILRKHPAGAALRAQIVHAANPDGAALLRKHMDSIFRCTWLPLGTISPVLGAHTGPSLVGIGYAAVADYPDVA
jgi:DegV family protein with EDD domain